MLTDDELQEVEAFCLNSTDKEKKVIDAMKRCAPNTCHWIREKRPYIKAIMERYPRF